MLLGGSRWLRACVFRGVAALPAGSLTVHPSHTYLLFFIFILFVCENALLPLKREVVEEKSEPSLPAFLSFVESSFE